MRSYADLHAPNANVNDITDRRDRMQLEEIL